MTVESRSTTKEPRTELTKDQPVRNYPLSKVHNCTVQQTVSLLVSNDIFCPPAILVNMATIPEPMPVVEALDSAELSPLELPPPKTLSSHPLLTDTLWKAPFLTVKNSTSKEPMTLMI